MKKIVKGNDFALRIPVMKMVEGQAQAFPLPAFDYAYNTILPLGGEEQRGFIMSIGQELVHVANLETIKEILTELFDASTATAYETFVKKTIRWTSTQGSATFVVYCAYQIGTNRKPVAYSFSACLRLLTYLPL